MTTRILLGTLELPGDMVWIDEYASPVVEAVTPLVSGIRYIEESTVLSGRPITLKLPENAWVSRSVVDSLYAEIEVGKTMSLMLSDNRVFSVRWRLRDGAMQATVVRWRAPTDDFVLYNLELYLETA